MSKYEVDVNPLAGFLAWKFNWSHTGLFLHKAEEWLGYSFISTTRFRQSFSFSLYIYFVFAKTDMGSTKILTTSWECLRILHFWMMFWRISCVITELHFGSGTFYCEYSNIFKKCLYFIHILVLAWNCGHCLLSKWRSHIACSQICKHQWDEWPSTVFKWGWEMLIHCTRYTLVQTVLWNL